MRLCVPLKYTASVLLAFAAMGGLSAVNAADAHFYRYTDDQGVLVMNSAIPPEQVKQGYEIVTLSGKVLEVVPPALTLEQAKQATSDRMRASELAEWDRSLRLRYGSIAEVESSRDRKLNDFDTNILILKSNADNVQAKIAGLQSRAARIERSGRVVPQSLIENIKTNSLELKEAQSQIELRKKERQELELQYEKDLERFIIITNKSKT